LEVKNREGMSSDITVEICRREKVTIKKKKKKKKKKKIISMKEGEGPLGLLLLHFNEIWTGEKPSSFVMEKGSAPYESKRIGWVDSLTR